ncbi:MAG: DUF58 domain-containing protein [Kofleriaceae bacterium]
MIPRLAPRGALIAASALLFLLVGALRSTPPVVAMAGVVLGLLLASYLAFFPTAILLRRKKIELSWWVPPGEQPGGALTVDRPFALHLAFRNHGARTLRVLRTRVLTSSALELPVHPSATVPAGRQVEVTAQVLARAAGYQVLHGAVLGLGDWLGLFEVEAYFPNPVALKVFPRNLPSRQVALAVPASAAIAEAGLHQVRRRGVAGELRELREHAHGDPFKLIAWKATARRGKLMVRDLENELVSTQLLLVDVGVGMRTGALGTQPLDWAIDLVSGLARGAAGGADRVGLVAFDTRVTTHVAPGAGHHHALALIERLLDARAVVDEDLTDVTAGELVAQVARYLAHQEGVDVRIKVPPAIDDPRWNLIQAGPDGQLYDLAVTSRLVSKLVEVMGRDARRAKGAKAPAWWWTRGRETPRGVDLQHELLRQFCRLRGIELPYRHLAEHGRRAAGFAEAVGRAVDGVRPDVVVVLSDLAGLAEDEATTARAIARARRAAGQLVVAVPSPDRFLPDAETELGDRVRALAARDLAQAQQRARHLLARRGVRVVEVGPTDGPHALLGGLGRSPRARSA